MTSRDIGKNFSPPAIVSKRLAITGQERAGFSRAAGAGLCAAMCMENILLRASGLLLHPRMDQPCDQIEGQGAIIAKAQGVLGGAIGRDFGL